MSGPGRDHGASSPAALNRAQYSSSSSTVRVVWTAMVASPHFMGTPPPAGRQPRDGLRLAYLHLARLGRRGPKPRDGLRLAYLHLARLGRRGPSPATACGSPIFISLASAGGAPAPRRPAARTTACGPHHGFEPHTLHCWLSNSRPSHGSGTRSRTWSRPTATP